MIDAAIIIRSPERKVPAIAVLARIQKLIARISRVTWQLNNKESKLHAASCRTIYYPAVKPARVSNELPGRNFFVRSSENKACDYRYRDRKDNRINGRQGGPFERERKRENFSRVSPAWYHRLVYSVRFPLHPLPHVVPRGWREITVCRHADVGYRDNGGQFGEVTLVEKERERENFDVVCVQTLSQCGHCWTPMEYRETDCVDRILPLVWRTFSCARQRTPTVREGNENAFCLIYPGEYILYV